MLLHIVTLIIIILCEVKSDLINENTWKDMNNTKIDNIEEYCKNKNCLVKCCPDNHVMVLLVSKNFSCYKTRIDYTEFNKYFTSDNLMSDNNTSYFHFVQGHIFSDLNKNAAPLFKSKIELFEDGSLKFNGSFEVSRLRFCVDFIMNSPKFPAKLAFQYVTDPKIPDAEAKQLYLISGMLISSFFMLLVFLVYAVLPNLQNLVGMVLMAYLVSLSVGFILRAAELITITYPSSTSFSCTDSNPAYYFFILASFFWLNIMSFDLWWTFRGARKSRDIHRQGERVKFFWYCVYAWGTPTIITLIVFIIDKQHLYSDIKYRPPFTSCGSEDIPTRLYMHLPIGVMTLANCVLFLMTVYNIWLIKRRVTTNNESRTTRKEENRFAVYLKLFIIMGVNWVFEQISSSNLSLVWYFLLNFMPLFNGVFIFYMFVCKKTIILMLCKRFNLQNSFVDRLGLAINSYADSTKSSGRKNHYSQKPSEQESLSTNTTEV